MSLTTLVKTIQDIMRKDVGVDGDAQRISQMVWLIFLKIFDDREQEWELTNPKYKSPIPSRFRWRNWAANPEGDTGDDLIDFVNNEMFPKLKTLATKGRELEKIFDPLFVSKFVNDPEKTMAEAGTVEKRILNHMMNRIPVSNVGHVKRDLMEPAAVPARISLGAKLKEVDRDLAGAAMIPPAKHES